MNKTTIVKIATLCISIITVSACSTTSLFEAMTGINLNGPGKKYEVLPNGQLVEIKPRQPDSSDLFVEKNLIGDVLTGTACQNKYNFVMKIIATNSDYVGNDAYYRRDYSLNRELNGDLYNWAHAYIRDSVPPKELMAVMTVKTQTEQPLSTKLVANLNYIRQGQGMMNLYGYVVLPPGKRITVDEAKQDLLRAIRLDIVKDTKGAGWEGTISGENFPTCLDLTLKSTQGRTTTVFAEATYPYKYVNTTNWGHIYVPKYGVLVNKVDPEVQIFWTKKHIAKHPEDNFLLGNMYNEFAKSNPSYFQKTEETLLIAAEINHDFRAYRSLAQLYEEGHLNDPDHSKAKLWHTRFVEAYRPANQICSDPRVRKAFADELNNNRGEQIRELIANHRTHQGDQILEIFAAYFTGLDHSFECTAVIKRNVEHRDVSLFDEDDYPTDPLAGMFDIAYQMSNLRREDFLKKPYTTFIKVYPQGNGNYALSNGSHTLGIVTYQPKT